MPHSYEAVFTTGDTKKIKSTERVYDAAWLAVVEFPDGHKRQWSGFARTVELARRAIFSETAFFTGSKRRSRYSQLKPSQAGSLVYSEVAVPKIGPAER